MQYVFQEYTIPFSLLRLIALALSLTCATVASSKTISVPHDLESLEIDGNQVEYLEDPDQTYSITDITKVDREWNTSTQEIINFGYTSSAFWFRLNLNNESNQIFDGILELSYPILDFVDFYIIKQGSIAKAAKNGDRRPFTDREVKTNSSALRFSMEPGENIQIVFRIMTDSSLQTPIVLWSEMAFWPQRQWPFAVQFLYFGFALAMVIYNLFIYLSHRSLSYLLYVCLAMSYTIFQLGLQGFGFQFFWPNIPIINKYIVPFSIPFTLFFGTMFPIKLLNIRHLSPWIFRILIASVYAVASLAILSLFTTSSFPVRVQLGTSILMAILCILAGSKSWKTGNPLGFYFTIGWAFFLTGTIITALNKFGVFQRTTFTELAQQIGSVFELTVFSFVLAYRMNLLIKERKEAQLETLKAQQEYVLSQKEKQDALEQNLIALEQEKAEKNHVFRQLGKIVFPHQISQIQQGSDLEDTMPVHHAEGCVISFDIIESSKLQHVRTKEFLRNLFRRCNEAIMEGYDEVNMVCRGYRIKEMGDGFLCSVGYPFKSPEHNIAIASIHLAYDFFNILVEESAILEADVPVRCGIGIAFDTMAGFYPESGTKEYDLYGRGIMLATRYESMRKSTGLDVLENSIIILQERVYVSLSKEMRNRFSSFDLKAKGLNVRDDPSASAIFYQYLKCKI